MSVHTACITACPLSLITFTHFSLPAADLDVPLGGNKPDNSWAPANDETDLWISISSENTCKVYDLVKGEPPDFTGAGGEESTRNIMCCGQDEEVVPATVAVATPEPSPLVRLNGMVQSCRGTQTSDRTSLLAFSSQLKSQRQRLSQRLVLKKYKPSLKQRKKKQKLNKQRRSKKSMRKRRHNIFPSHTAAATDGTVRHISKLSSFAVEKTVTRFAQSQLSVHWVPMVSQWADTTLMASLGNHGFPCLTTPTTG